MSRSRHQHKKSYDWPKNEGQKWSNRIRRNYGRMLISEYEKAKDVEAVDLPDQIDKDTGKGDPWKWD